MMVYIFKIFGNVALKAVNFGAGSLSEFGIQGLEKIFQPFDCPVNAFVFPTSVGIIDKAPVKNQLNDIA